MSLIIADLEFFRDFALNREIESARSIIALALMPFLSAFVYESAAYLRKKGLLELHNLEPYESLLRTSRMRIKLLDDDRRSFADILERSSQLASVSSKWMLEPHRGILGPLKRYLQNDLGVYFVRGEVVNTTHTATLNLGLTANDLDDRGLTLSTLGPYLHDTAVDFGEYIGLLLGVLQQPKQPLGNLTEGPVPPIEFRDVKSARLYESIARTVAPGHKHIALLLTSILSQVNAARLLAPLVAGSRQFGTFKIQFLSLYHAASSVQKVLNEDRKNGLIAPNAREQFESALRSGSIRRVRKNSGLRNCLMHYGVVEPVAANLAVGSSFFGVIEAYTSGSSYATVHDDVQNGLEGIANAISVILPQSLTPRALL